MCSPSREHRCLTAPPHPHRPPSPPTGDAGGAYPQRIRGHFDTARRWSFLVLQAWMFLPPRLWRRGIPLVQADLAGRRIFAFGGFWTARATVALWSGWGCWTQYGFVAFFTAVMYADVA